MNPFATATELLADLRAGRVTSSELTEMYIGRIEKHDLRLNAVVERDFDRARGQARAAARGGNGALPGLPITLKESFNVSGLRTTCGVPERERRGDRSGAERTRGGLGYRGLHPRAGGVLRRLRPPAERDAPAEERAVPVAADAERGTGDGRAGPDGAQRGGPGAGADRPGRSGGRRGRRVARGASGGAAREARRLSRRRVASDPLDRPGRSDRDYARRCGGAPRPAGLRGRARAAGGARRLERSTISSTARSSS